MPDANRGHPAAPCVANSHPKVGEATADAYPFMQKPDRKKSRVLAADALKALAEGERMKPAAPLLLTLPACPWYAGIGLWAASSRFLGRGPVGFPCTHQVSRRAVRSPTGRRAGGAHSPN